MSKFLNDFKNFVCASRENIYTISEFCIGSEVETVEIQPCNACNNIYSVSKLFTVTAVGVLVDRGLLQTDETVAAILRDEMPKTYNKHWDATTVDMLLRHRVGIPCNSLDIDCMDASKFDADYLKEVTTLPWECVPDTKRQYTDGAYYILSRIVAKRAGVPLQQFLWETVFLPLGFKEAAWSCCPKGHAMGATGLYISSADMVKLGAVYLQNGIWQDKRIISEHWVQTVLQRGYELSGVRDIGAYQKGGMLGQKLLIIPAQDRVVGWLGHRREIGADFEAFIREYTASSIEH